MVGSSPGCLVVMYHYVRDLPRTPFPRIKGLLVDNFNHQVDYLRTRYEMATLESAIAFWQSRYVPARDLCLLTFDDGLEDHYTGVLPILAERKIQGVFFIITACLEEGRVGSIHKNHFLMAALGFEKYRRAFVERLVELSPGVDVSVDIELARSTYRWDDADVAAFKYLVNFRLTEALRDQIVDELSQEHLGDEAEFARQLYLSWGQAKEMQRAGMIIGGHSHRHGALAALTPGDQQREINMCATILQRRLDEQLIWPFSYPHGKRDTFNEHTMRLVKQNGFACAFSSVPGPTWPGDDVYALRRVDTNSVQAEIGATRSSA